jgi:DNA-binding NtrC family response regulator
VVVDCGSLSPALIESELFGHVKGAFTGAGASRDGAFASAEGGTILLDEVGELPLEHQPKLLRVLENRTIRRVGEDLARPVDVRIIAATNRDLQAEAKAGTFREDLFFRLAVQLVRVPPLRERLEDIPLLTLSILNRLGRPNFELSPELLARLSAHHWPGNIRELRNVIERAVTGASMELEEVQTGGALADPKPYKQAKEALIEHFTREYFTRLFNATDGNVSELARTAGIARTYAHEVVKKYGLRRS